MNLADDDSALLFISHLLGGCFSRIEGVVRNLNWGKQLQAVSVELLLISAAPVIPSRVHVRNSTLNIHVPYRVLSLAFFFFFHFFFSFIFHFS